MQIIGAFWWNLDEEPAKEVERPVNESTARNNSDDTSDMSSDDITDKPRTEEVVATFYTARCEGCTGITKTGIDVRNTVYTPDGYRVIATDPAVIPLGSIVKVTLENGKSFEAKAEDIGGAIKGARIDVLVSNKARAYELGRQMAEVQIISEG